MTPILEVKGLAKTFRTGFRRKKVEAIRDVSFSLHENEILGLVGANGAGKTTTLKVLTGLIRADRGTATMFGQSVEKPEVRARLGYLPESPYFYEHLNVRELLHFYGRLTAVPTKTLSPRIDELIERVGLRHAEDRPLRKFSKGMRQRAGIAQALINDPDLVILDEPQSGLDPIGRREVRDLIAQLKTDGKTVMFSSHILPDVEAVCDRVVLMDRGVVVEEGGLVELTGNRVESWEVTVRGISVADLPGDGLRRSETRGDTIVAWYEEQIDPITVVAALADTDAELLGVVPNREGLEDVFIRDARGGEP